MPRLNQEIPATPVKFVLFSSRPYKKWAVFALSAVVLAAAGESLIPYVVKNIVDGATQLTGSSQAEYSVVLFWVIIYPILDYVQSLFWRMSGYTGSRWVTGAEAEGYKKLFEYMSKHSQTFFDNNFAGSLSGSISIATSSVVRIIENVLWQYTGFIVRILVSIYLILTANYLIAIIFTLWLVILIPINFFLAKKQRGLSEHEAQTQTELRGVTVDTTTNITAVHQYAARDFELKRLNEAVDKYKGATLKSWWFSEHTLMLNDFLLFGFVASTTFLAFFSWRNGDISIGDFVMITTLVSTLLLTLLFIGKSMNNFAKNIGQIKKGLDDILHPHEIVDRKGAKDLKVEDATVSLKDLSFKYPEGTQVLDNVSLEIDGKQSVGIVGPSGAGKTTLIRLLLRQHEATSGGVYIDGQNINDVKLDSLRSQIGVVPQEPLLFHRTIKENIGYGKPGASDTEITEAAKLAQAHDFIQTLPQKYDTLVGERGVKLSAGQRQRIAISRAILKDAPILILDEATSALDSESEVAIQKALETLMKGKTVFAVAHRLSTLSEMDRIIVLKDGEIIQDGTHTELLKEKGSVYANLWEHQAGGFLLE